MMHILLIWFAVYVSVIDGRIFRNDYTYHDDIDGWIKLHRIPTTWEEARLRCFREGSVLASPLDDELMAAMTKEAADNGLKIFTGISAIFSSYFSVEGIPLDELSVRWALGEPNNVGNNENCLIMIGTDDGTFADVPCTDTYPYICYKKNTQNMPSVGQCGTTDPEYVLYDRTGHCYKFHDLGQTWARAYMTCAAEGGHLAIINSEKEANVLKEIIFQHPAHKITAKHKDYIGVGFRDWSEHGVFMTIHGETLKEAGYDRWSAGQPDNFTTGEYCGSIFRNALLNDIWCMDTIPFICEKLRRSLVDDQSAIQQKRH